MCVRACVCMCVCELHISKLHVYTYSKIVPYVKVSG